MRGHQSPFDSVLMLLTDTDDGVAVKDAALTAARYGSRLKLLEVWRPPSRWLLRLVDWNRPATSRLILEHRRVELQMQLAAALGNELARHVEITVSQATVSDAMRRELRGFRPDLVVVPTRKEGTVDRGLKRMLRSCPVPVWTARPHEAKRAGRILAAVSAEESDERAAVDEAVLRLARDVARRESAALEVVHAWKPYGEHLVSGPRGRRSLEHAVAHARLVEADHRRLLRRCLRRVELPDVRHHLLRGEPGQVINELAQRRGYDLIVVGTLGRSGLAGAIIGNTAEEVVAGASCAVLSVKADEVSAPLVSSTPELVSRRLDDGAVV